MVVRVQVLVLALAMPEQFEAAVRDHLVGVHVRGGARAALDHVDDELVVQLAGDDLVAGLDDRVGFAVLQRCRVRGSPARAAFFVKASARTKCAKCDRRMPEKGKFSTARSVCTP